VRLTRAAAALALTALTATPAAAGEWKIDRRTGACREVWSARDLVRGPTALLNGVLRPVTAFTGGVWFAAAECHHSPRCLWVGPLWVVGSTGWGIAEGLYWIATGIADTPTLGAALIAPFPAARLQLGPVVPFVESHPPSDAERCAS
jgi:hypothetical protein